MLQKNNSKTHCKYLSKYLKEGERVLILNIAKNDKVYITNTVFWRPPDNRRPTPEEIAVCRPYVEKHIALINPKLLVLVGSTAVESLLGKSFCSVGMRELRSKYWEYKNC